MFADGGREATVPEEMRAARLIRVQREQGEGGWFYATSPDLRGLLVAQPTLEVLNHAIPQAITDLYAARGIAIYVTPLDDGNEGPHGSVWVAVPVNLTKEYFRKQTTAKA
jgi:hypothetical protein